MTIINTQPFPTSLQLPYGTLDLPAFLPDATLGVVRSVDSADVQACGIQAVVMNTFHLMQHPGSSTISALGGLHEMCAWPRPIITDSGGFQAYSLIHQNSKYGSLTSDGMVFKPDGAKRKFRLTPEKCVQLQVSYGSDVVMCLDDCTHVDQGAEEQRTAVDRTVQWAERCKAEFVRLLRQKGMDPDADGSQRPLLFGVIQGGGERALRRECAERLLEIGFDGFGYGGWPLDGNNNLLIDMLSYVRSLVPAHYALHALGVGHPASVAACIRLGYGIFDCALPTRDARQGRLYMWNVDPAAEAARIIRSGGSDWFSFLYIKDDKHIKDRRPVSEHCDCHTCGSYSRGYLKHLFDSGDVTYMRLATIHNLRFMATLMEAARALR